METTRIDIILRLAVLTGAVFMGLCTFIAWA
jgi:hypothetical protein